MKKTQMKIVPHNIALVLAAVFFTSAHALLPNNISQGSNFRSFIQNYPGFGRSVDETDQESATCDKALCKIKYQLNENSANHCFRFKSCGRCTVSSVPNHPVCYLVGTDDSYISLMEGHLGNSPNAAHEGASNANSSKHNHSEHDDEHDEESFLQAETSSSLQFVPTSAHSDFDHLKRSCAIDNLGNVRLRARLIIQWYKLKDETEGDHQDSKHEGHYDEGSEYLQFGSNDESMLEMFNSDDEGHQDSHGSVLSKLSKKFNVLKKTHQVAVTKLQLPKATIHFAFSSPKVNSCREPVIFKGSISPSSMFVSTLNILISQIDLSEDMVKSSISTMIRCKTCQYLNFNSCIQVSCASRSPAAPMVLSSPMISPMPMMAGINMHSSYHPVMAAMPMGHMPTNIQNIGAVGVAGMGNGGFRGNMNPKVMMPIGVPPHIQSGFIMNTLCGILSLFIMGFYLIM